MAIVDDNELARYLASYLEERDHDFVELADDTGLIPVYEGINVFKLRETITQFLDTLP